MRALSSVCSCGGEPVKTANTSLRREAGAFAPEICCYVIVRIRGRFHDKQHGKSLKRFLSRPAGLELPGRCGESESLLTPCSVFSGHYFGMQRSQVSAGESLREKAANRWIPCKNPCLREMSSRDCRHRQLSWQALWNQHKRLGSNALCDSS